MKIISVVGARPNFMKIAPFVQAIERHNENAKKPVLEHLLVHTGQHYDDKMSQGFFDELCIPQADLNLGIGSGSHAEQVGRTMIEFEKVLKAHRPDWVVVVGDVNATCACSITAKKEQVKLAHIEAGLRSRDMSMPEEINRLVTDRLSDLLFTPDPLSSANLRAEGVPEEKILFAGNIMIDTLEQQRDRASQLNLAEVLHRNLLLADQKQSISAITAGHFAAMTLHRPSNVDCRGVFEPLMKFLLDELSAQLPLVWPIHPRARKQLETYGLWDRVRRSPKLILLEPVGYHDMLKLNLSCRMLLTDSGGLQEECCVLGTPCLTLRANTERPVTLREHGGASVLVGNDIGRLRIESQLMLNIGRHPVRPENWDGNTARRIVEALAQRG